MAAKKTKKVEGPQFYEHKPDWRVRDGFEPTRTFEVGELVAWGNHCNSEIIEVKEGGVYRVRCWGVKPVYGTPTPYESFHEVNWYWLAKAGASQETSFTKPQTYQLDHQTRVISGLLSMVHGDHAGVDFSPEYQREHVWTQEDKEKLIDSIFNHVSIGLFVFVKREYQHNDKQYEVLDGKQRLTALVDFFEDRFTYKGFFYSQLGWRDQHHFEEYGVNVGVLRQPSEKEKLACFIAVNTFGKVMDEKHLASVRSRYEEL